MKEMMQECMKKCRWCPLIPLTLGIVFLLLGIYLPVDIVRILWIVFAGLITLMGLICFIMAGVMSKAMKE